MSRDYVLQAAATRAIEHARALAPSLCSAEPQRRELQFRMALAHFTGAMNVHDPAVRKALELIEDAFR